MYSSSLSSSSFFSCCTTSDNENNFSSTPLCYSYRLALSSPCNNSQYGYQYVNHCPWFVALNLLTSSRLRQMKPYGCGSSNKQLRPNLVQTKGTKYPNTIFALYQVNPRACGSFWFANKFINYGNKTSQLHYCCIKWNQKRLVLFGHM